MKRTIDTTKLLAIGPRSEEVGYSRWLRACIYDLPSMEISNCPVVSRTAFVEVGMYSSIKLKTAKSCSSVMCGEDSYRWVKWKCHLDLAVKIIWNVTSKTRFCEMPKSSRMEKSAKPMTTAWT